MIIDDLSQANPAVDATPSSTSAPETTGTAVAPEGLPGTTPEVTPANFDPPVPDDDAIEPPAGASPAQRENWNKLAASRDNYKAQAAAHEQQVQALQEQLNVFDGIVEDAAKFADITRRPEIGEADVYEFEQLLYELNQPLWEGLVRKAVERYTPHVTGQSTPPADQPATAAAPGALPSDGTLPEGFESELEYLTEANPAVAAKIVAALEAEKQLQVLNNRVRQIEDRHAATEAGQKDFAHDRQFGEYVVGLFEQHHVPRVVKDETGVEKPNPVMLSWIEDLMARVENDPVAGADLERSRRAFRGELGNQKAAIPALGAKVRAAIGRVFTESVAPRLAGYQPPPTPVPTLTPDELRARAGAQPPPVPGGAAAPVPGQYKDLPIRERVKAIYRAHGVAR